MKRFIYFLLLSVSCMSLAAQQLTNEDLYVTYGNSLYMKSIARMELVTEAEYRSKMKSAVDFLDTEKNVIKKNNNQLVLPCKKGKIKYTDNLKEDETYAKYEYIGQIDFLNVYMLEFVYWEASGYIFVNRTTGEEIESFEDYPYISADKKNIVCVKRDPYELSANILIYKIKSGELSIAVSDNFEYWIPFYDKPLFWSDDNCMYIPAIHIKDFDVNKDMNKICQYIKLNILE